MKSKYKVSMVNGDIVLELEDKIKKLEEIEKSLHRRLQKRAEHQTNMIVAEINKLLKPKEGKND